LDGRLVAELQKYVLPGAVSRTSTLSLSRPPTALLAIRSALNHARPMNRQGGSFILWSVNDKLPCIIACRCTDGCLACQAFTRYIRPAALPGMLVPLG